MTQRSDYMLGFKVTTSLLWKLLVLRLQIAESSEVGEWQDFYRNCIVCIPRKSTYRIQYNLVTVLGHRNWPSRPLQAPVGPNWHLRTLVLKYRFKWAILSALYLYGTSLASARLAVILTKINQNHQHTLLSLSLAVVVPDPGTSPLGIVFCLSLLFLLSKLYQPSKQVSCLLTSLIV